MIDHSSRMLGEATLGKVTAFTFSGDLLLMIHELLFLLVAKKNSRFPFRLLKVTPLASVALKTSVS